MRKCKFNIRKTSRASVSVMLSFLMLPVYTFGAAVVDGVRVSSARQMAESAADITVQAGLSDFDSVLQSVYGLFAVSETEDELQRNLSDYFYRTVNNTALTEEDPEGRKYISGIASVFSDPSHFDFNNLVSLTAENFSAEYTDGAVLADPEVLRSQINEYMKYTGPLKMSSGILYKLSAFSDFRNQNKAMTAKIVYDKSLDRINRLCTEAWKNASAYNDFLAAGSFKGVQGVSENAEKIRQLYRDAVTQMVMYHSAENYGLTVFYDNGAEQYIRELADDAGVSVYEAAAEWLVRRTVKPDGSDSELVSRIRSIDSEQDSFRFVTETEASVPEFSYVCTIADIFTDEYSSLSDDERENGRETYEKVIRLKSLIYGLVSDAQDERSLWKNTANSRCRQAADLLADFCAGADEAAVYLENTKYALEDLLITIDKAKENRDKWRQAVDALAEGDVKTSMKNEYDRGAEGLDKNDIAEYQQITENNLQAFRNLRAYAEQIKFYGTAVLDSFDYTAVYSANFRDRAVCSVSDASSAASQEVSENLTVPGECLDGEYHQQGSSYAFYRYLSQNCSSTYVSEADRKTAGKLLDTLNSLGNPDSACGTDKPAHSSLLTFIPEGRYKNITGYSEVPELSEEFSTSSVKPDAGKMLENNEELLNSTGNFLDRVGELGVYAAEKSWEDLVFSEYVMQMFSCQTSDKKCTGSTVKDIKPKMLSGIEMNEENNVFYKSEAEYILWGNTDMQKNVQYTQALIFGTRFSLNSIYAFTDSEIRSVTSSAAAAIAGWTGFGEPVVKTVLVMSLALAESVIDLKQLTDGDSVPVYKNSATWNMKPSGLIHALVNNTDELAQTAAKAAGKKTSDIFDRIEEAAGDGIDSMKKTVTDYVDEYADEAVDTAVNALNNAVFSSVTGAMENTEGNLTREDIRRMIEDEISGINSGSSKINSAVSGAAVQIAEGAADSVADIIYQGYSSVSGKSFAAVKDAEKQVTDQTEKIIDSLRGPLRKNIEGVCDDLKDKASESISAAGECAEEYAMKFVGDLVTGAASSLAASGIDAGSIQTDKVSAPSAVSALKLTYQEYLRIFLMLNSMSETKERAMLTRTAVLIDVNMNHGMKNAAAGGRKFTPERNFDAGKAHTMITADADVSVSTWFLAALIPEGRKDDSSSSGINRTEKKKTVSVRSVLSY